MCFNLSMQNTIEISVDAARELLPCLEIRYESFLNRQHEAAAQAESTKVLIEELKAKLNGDSLTLPNGEARKRLPKGFADDAIEKALKTIKPGDSLTLNEIVSRSGIKYSTVFKILTDAKRNRGRFVQEKDEWKLK